MTDRSRQEVDAKLAASEAKVDARLANFDTTMKTGFAELRAEIHKTAADLLKWGAGIAFASVATTVGLLTYLNRAAEKPAVAPAQVPIIIAVPAAPQVPSGTHQTPSQPSK